MAVVVTYTEAAGNVHVGPGFYFKNILRPLFLMRPLIQAGNPPSVSDPVAPGTWVKSTAYTTGVSFIVDSNNNIELATTGGTSGSGSAPTWATTYGSTTTDNSVVWTNVGPSFVWAASTAVIYDQQVRDAVYNHIWQCILAGTTGTSLPSDTGIPYGGIIPDGTAIWMNLGPTISIGSHVGALDWSMGAKQIPIMSDSFTAPVEAAITEEDASITGTFQELNPLNVSRVVPNTVYSTGTDPLFPPNAQLYQELTFGGSLRIPFTCDLLVSYKRQYGNSNQLSSQPFKYFGGTIYKSGPESPGKIAFTLKKTSEYAVNVKGYVVPWRPVGDNLGQFFDQL